MMQNRTTTNPLVEHFTQKEILEDSCKPQVTILPSGLGPAFFFPTVCLLHIQERRKKLIYFNICRIQRLAFHWSDCRRQRNLSLLLRVAVTVEELTLCSAVTSRSLKTHLKTQPHKNFCHCRTQRALVWTSRTPAKQGRLSKYIVYFWTKTSGFFNYLYVDHINSQSVSAIECKNPQNQQVIN